MTAIRLRLAALRDVEATAGIQRRAFRAAMPHMPDLHTPMDDVAFHRDVVYPTCMVWVAQEGTFVVGFIAFRADTIEHLYVDPDHQGRGFGKALLRLAMAPAQTLALWTFQCNRRARGFYEAHGFRVECETDGAGNEERQPDVRYVWIRSPSDG